MRTDRLIEMLSTNVEPVAPRWLEKAMIWAVVAGAVAAFSVMLLTVAPRQNLAGVGELGFLGLKLLFAIGVIGPGVAYLMQSVRPGQNTQKPFAVLSLPFAVIAAVALAAVLAGPSATRTSMIFGTRWAMCLVCIPLFAVLPFAALIWALRKGAPTNLRRTGALAGLVAGGLGAAAYAFHCPDDSLPFVAVWYGGSIALLGAIGALLGPKLLRW